MSEQAMKTVVCTECGKTLQIPQELTDYSCIYCGARLHEQPKQPAVDEADREQVGGRLVQCVANYPDYQRRITRDLFQPAFELYEEGCRPIIEALDAAYRFDGEQLLPKLVGQFLDDLEARWQSFKPRERKTKKMDDKLIVAIFMVPMIRRQQLSVSEPFCELLQKTWIARYPDNPFYLGNYEDISAGFRKKIFGLCFITTAVCQSRGLADDCAELTAFRAFRDGYLRACPDGEALIDEYYNIAPGIVRCIELGEDSGKKYDELRRVYLEPCYADLQNGRYESCKTRYVAMVRSLEKQYLS